MSTPSASPRVRRLHRVLGLALALPLFAWAATGLLFHLKPGWGPAYAALSLPFEPLEEGFAIPAGTDWLEARRLRTALGEHLLQGQRQGDRCQKADQRQPG